MKEHPILETTRLVLRPFTLADAPGVQQLAGERDVAATTLLPHPYETGVAEQWISTHQKRFELGQLNFAIIRHADNVLLGALALRITLPHSHAKLAYWIGKPHWNNGYCTEAAQVVVQYGFTALSLHRIHASCIARNLASKRVLEKVGMVAEGCQRQHIQRWGVFEDVAFYGVLKGESLPPQ